MINMNEQMKKEFQVIELLSSKANKRHLKRIFLARKTQSQQSQPYKLKLPSNPPIKDLCRKGTCKRSLQSKTRKSEIKQYIRGRQTSKSVVSAMTKDEDQQSNKIANIFGLRNYWNKFKMFANFQKLLAFKSKHFRNFCIIRKYFYMLQTTVYLKKMSLKNFLKEKHLFSLRKTFSK